MSADDFFEQPRRRGGSGRIPDALRATHQKAENHHYTCTPELFARLNQYCIDDERAQSWVIQKALDVWLTERGY